MANLKEQSCEACRLGAPLATPEDIELWMPQLTEWQIVDVDTIERLTRTYQFKNFVDALAFTNKVGEIAESMGHHPALLTEWGRVTVSWWTHKIKGLHKNDFICAAKTDAIYPSLSK